jgi:hypothetical protein
LDYDKFIFCLEVPDIEIGGSTEVVKTLQIAIEYGIRSIYKTCDTIEGLEESFKRFAL